MVCQTYRDFHKCFTSNILWFSVCIVGICRQAEYMTFCQVFGIFGGEKRDLGSGDDRQERWAGLVGGLAGVRIDKGLEAAREIW